MERQLPQPGWRYRHFKGGLYQIVTLAVHTETEETMVVYQALYNDFKVYVRPLSMFLGKTDLKKYPDSRQFYRFERIDPTATEPDCLSGQTSGISEQKSERDSGQIPTSISGQGFRQIPQPISGQGSHPTTEIREEPLPEGVSPALMAFLDADSDEERYTILNEMEDIVDDHMIDTMAVVSDIVIDDGPINKRYQELKRCIRTRIQYESKRFPRHIS